MSPKRKYRNTSASPTLESPSKLLRSYDTDDTDIGSGDEGYDTGNENGIKVYIVQAKMDPETVDELVQLVEGFDNPPDAGFTLELCSEVDVADVIVTAVRMRKRLERHVPWQVAQQKALVTPNWLRDSVKQRKLAVCGDYVAIRELEEPTERNCPEPQTCSSSSELSEPRTVDTEDIQPEHVSDEDANYMARYACLRHMPLLCPNEDLLAHLGILRQSRDLEGLAIRALSYERAIASVKAFPHKITHENMNEVARLPYVGEKIRSKIKEFLRTGRISEARTIASEERYRSLSAFTTIYGIGPATARALYSRELRTIEDLEQFYDVPGECPDHIEGLEPESRIIRTGNFPELSIKVGIALRKDFEKKIPKAEVEEMRRIVMGELDAIRTGCVCTIVGGYRRGKPESNDVDIVISHPDMKHGRNQVKGLSQDLTRRLFDCGLVTHVLHIQGFHERNVLRTHQWDALEKALTVFRLPGKDSVHRRLDLIFAMPEVYWTAVVGWTGSKMFERDLRLYAKQERGMKFDSSGITRRHDSKQFFPKTEKEVFDLLGLPYIHPTMRNADA